MEMRITEYPGFCRRGTKRPRDEAIEEHVETIIESSAKRNSLHWPDDAIA